MGRFFRFIAKNKNTTLFLLLEIVCVWLLISFNKRYNASFLNTSGRLIGNVNQSKADLDNYFQLKEINAALLSENRKLKEVLFNSSVDSQRVDSQRFILQSARVIDNSFRRSKNFFTLNKGKSDGIQQGMGVISKDGIAGQVKSVSNRFSTVYSLLHPNMRVSSRVKRTNSIGTVQWDQEDFRTANLKYIPRHIDLRQGDSVVTSGFNAVFPEGILIGTVSNIYLEDYMTFYEVDIDLSTDFTALEYVYIVQDTYKEELDSLKAELW
jgi:rod shape-determining protein MreC